MKILSLTTKDSGCGYHRIWNPTLLMQKEKGWVRNFVTPEILDEGWDIVFINRCWDFNDLIELKRVYGFKLVVDVDDYWILDHHHLLYEDYNFSNFASRVVRHLKNADLVTCTHDRLAEMCKPYNSNAIVLPNAIPYGQGQFTDKKTEDEHLRLFWAGGITHADDIRQIAGVMRKVDDVKVVIGGYTDSNQTEMHYWGKMVNYMTNNRRLAHDLIKGVPPNEYYELFAHGDVMLVPLQKTMFNQYKSNLKILEAAGKKMPVICSAVHPYLGFPSDVVLYAKTEGDWLRHIEYLKDPINREKQGQKLYDYCLENYNFDEINKQRQLAFENLLISV